MIITNKIILQDFAWLEKKIDFKVFRNKTFLITGASGFLGSLITTMLLYQNQKHNLQIKVIASGRQEQYNVWFAEFEPTDNLIYKKLDLNKKITILESINYIVHTACPTDSNFLKNFPLETYYSITNSIKNLLELAQTNHAYLLNFSSMEVYGTFTGKTKLVTETDQGAINLNNPRSAYPLGKLTAEYISNVYQQQYNITTATIRLAQTIGPGINYNANKVFLSFYKNAIADKEIQILSSGKSTRSLIYSADALHAIFLLLMTQATGCFNVANEQATLSILSMAKLIKKLFNKNITITVKNQQDTIYAEDTNIKLCTSKLEALGWQPEFNLKTMFTRMSQSFIE